MVFTKEAVGVNDGKELFCANMPNLKIEIVIRRTSLVHCVSVQLVVGCFFEANLKLFAGCVI